MGGGDDFYHNDAVEIPPILIFVQEGFSDEGKLCQKMEKPKIL